MIDAIKGKLKNVGCLAMIVMAVVMFVFGFCVEILDLDKRSNRDVVEILENRYKYCKSGLNNIVKGCEKLNRTDTISISYSSAHNRFEIEAKYEYLLKEMPFLRGNIRVFRDCFGDIEFSNGWVHFRGSGVKDMNCKFCSLLWCPNAENVDQRYRIFPYGQCPDDKEQYCLYHLEGDWYIRIP